MVKKAGTTQIEMDLARRVRRERERMGFSYADLAKAMTDVGCEIDKSAIYRIEKGDPPRKLSAGELIALGEVLGLTLDDLATPIDLVDKKRAREVVVEIDEVQHDLVAYVEKALRAWVEWHDIERDDQDLSEFAMNHLKAAIPSGSHHPIGRLVADPRFEQYGVPLDKMLRLVTDLEHHILRVAMDLSQAIAESETKSDG